jgi:hypothetical protein
MQNDLVTFGPVELKSEIMDISQFLVQKFI